MVAPVAQVTRLVFLTCIGLLLVILETDLLMLLAVGSAWSLQPRDGLHATTGNVSYFYLLVKQCYSKSLILNMSQNFKH